MAKPYHELGVYLRRRLGHLRSCHVLVEERIYDDIMAHAEKSKGHKDADSAMNRLMHHLIYGLGNTFRYTLLIGVCSFLEESVKAIAKELIPDDKKRAKTMEKKNGNWLQKHIHLLATLALDPTPFQGDLDGFNDLITVRNCITHSWGKVAKSRNPKETTDAVQRIKTAGKKENIHDHADLSKDGYVILGDRIIPHSVWLAECIVDALFTAMLKVSFV